MTAASVLYGLAYLVGALAFWLMARRRRLATEGIAMVAVAGLVGGLLGATIGQWVLTGGQPGKSVLGGWLGGWLAVWVTKKRLGLHRPTGDLFAVALMAGEAMGRWGCFVGGCCHGRACSLSWSVYQHDALRHPTQAYLSIACAATLVLLLLIERRRPAENTLFMLQGLVYPPLRFAVEFFRENERLHLGLSTAQWVCIGAFGYFVWRGKQQWKKNELV
jgi:phosphatidylglycerol---prolipoprotein diacylglyceryl transferase